MSGCGAVVPLRLLFEQQFEYKSVKTVVLRNVFPAQLSGTVPAELNLPRIPPEPGIPLEIHCLEGMGRPRVWVNTIGARI
jgi:hypothetical protein